MRYLIVVLALALCGCQPNLQIATSAATNICKGKIKRIEIQGATVVIECTEEISDR